MDSCQPAKFTWEVYMCQGTEKFYYVITTHIYIQISHYVYRLPSPTMSSFSFTQVSKKMRHWVQIFSALSSSRRQRTF